MVSRAERAASGGARVAGRGVGAGIGAAFSSPAGFVTIAIIALVGIAIFFRKDIGAFFEKTFEGFGKIELPDINFPEIKLPEINFPEINFPDFDFPDFKFPDFTDLFSGIQKQLDDLFKNQQSILAGQTVPFGDDEVIIPPDTVVNPDGTVSSSTPPISTGGGATIQELAFAQQKAAAFDTLFDLDILTGTQIQEAISNIEFGDTAALNALIVSIQSLANDELFGGNGGGGGLDNQGIGFDVPFNDPTGLAGGGSFIGGTTTFGDQTNIVDTLSEVLAIFPQLTASQASNALFSNPNLTANDFAQITPIQPSISSAGGDPEQIINNASGGFSGLTPEQIANILTGGNISNF